jgi:hypothetical protein
MPCLRSGHIDRTTGMLASPRHLLVAKSWDKVAKSHASTGIHAPAICDHLQLVPFHTGSIRSLLVDGSQICICSILGSVIYSNQLPLLHRIHREQGVHAASQAS